MQCLAAADRAQVQAPTRSRMHVMRCRLARTPCTATALNCSHGVCYRWLEPRVVTHKLLKFPFFVISDSRKCAWSRSHHKPCYTSGRRRLPGLGQGLHGAQASRDASQSPHIVWPPSLPLGGMLLQGLHPPFRSAVLTL